MDPILNFAKSNVNQGYDDTAVEIVLVSGGGAKFPNPGTDGAFNLVWYNSSDYGDPADDPNVEIVRCTSRSTDTLTITRAQEGTNASTKNTSGKTYTVILSPTKKTLDDKANKELDNVDFSALATVESPADEDLFVIENASGDKKSIANSKMQWYGYVLEKDGSGGTGIINFETS